MSSTSSVISSSPTSNLSSDWSVDNIDYSSNSSPGRSDEFSESNDMHVSRRGRPSLTDICTLIAEANASSIKCVNKCKYCGRMFPREKSLQAHLRTHTGERPYHCPFNGCNRSFTQSGQLRTHQRLHTGEKPFICADETCSNRYTHANRHCPLHPNAGLRREKRLTKRNLIPNSNVDARASFVKEEMGEQIFISHEQADIVSKRKLITQFDTVADTIPRTQDENFDTNIDLLWKKKKAAVECKVRRRICEQHIEASDKLIGAMALLQLSGVEVSFNDVLREAQSLQITEKEALRVFESDIKQLCI